MVPNYIKIIFSFLAGWLLLFSAIMLSYIIPGWDSLYPTIAKISTSDWIFYAVVGIFGGCLGVLGWVAAQ